MLKKSLSMQKVKVIKGTPLYHYRKSILLDKPSNLIIKKMLYDKDENITHVYLRHRNYTYDIMCLILILTITYFMVSNKTDNDVLFYYNNVVVYYNGYLYANIKNSEDSKYDISYTIGNQGKEISSGILKPGDYLTRLQVDNPSDDYELTLSYTTWLKTYTEELKLFTDIKTKQDISVQ